MHAPEPECIRPLRLLETWLPLAQALNERYGWHDDAAALEQLIVAAQPALALCANADEAHLVLFIARGGVGSRTLR
jgi:hypothetical protein